MKRVALILVVMALIGLLAAPAVAYNVAHKAGVGFNVGVARYRGEKSYTENSKFGFARELSIGYGLTSNISTIFNYGFLDLGADDHFDTEISPALSFKLQFSAFPEKRIHPFVFTGAGLIAFTPKDPQGRKIDIEDEEDRMTMVLLGTGAEIFFNEHVALNAFVDAHAPFTDQLDGLVAGDWDDWYWGVKAGLTFYVGDTDTDGDGIPDKQDLSLKYAEDFDSFQDGDGAPDYDNDQDAIPDIYDRAPNAPEDEDGFQDWDGAPDEDNDGDGIPDVWDKAPNQPEDFDGYEDSDGEPDYDNDGDGVPDIYDGAPNEPETVNGYMDWDGIPDGEKKPEPVKTDIMPQKVGEKVILRGVNFKTASAQLSLNSYVILDDVVEILKEHTEIQLKIEGHCDSRGEDAYNLDLSQRRADSVRNYLLQQGIEGHRLEAIGYGEKHPIASNETVDGRAQNRRVVFLRTQ